MNPPRMLRRLLIATTLAVMSACSTSPTAEPAGATFVVVRHAEKADDGSKDPPLTGAGEERARQLAASLADAPVVAVYSTHLRRTTRTAEPTARLHGLPVTTYDPAEPAVDLAARLRSAHEAGTVLVVGHSNTAPAIASALCECEVPPMDEQEYGRMLTISPGADARPRLSTGH